MRFHRNLAAILVCSLASGLIGSGAIAEDSDLNGELNSEINDLQIHMQKTTAGSHAAKLIAAEEKKSKEEKKNKKNAPVKIAKLKLTPVTQAPVWHSDVADNSISTLPPGPIPAPKDAPRARHEDPVIEEPTMEPVREAEKVQSTHEVAPVSTKTSTKSSFFRKIENIFQKVTLLPSASISTFDGDDSSKVVPSGVNYPVAANPAGTLLVDLNLGLGNFVLQTGVDYLSAGAETGYAPYQGFTTFTYNDKVTLRYIGMPLSMKYNLSNANQSGFYAKAGINPVYLAGHTYSTYTGYNNEFRLGGYSQWDFLFTAGIGYSLNVSDHFQVVLDVSGYQGMVSVFSTYNTYNVGGTAGLGLSYLL